MVSFEILVGLPASGKTFYSTKKEKENENVVRFDADRFAQDGGSIKSLIGTLRGLEYENDTLVIIDGLFYSEQATELHNTLHNTSVTIFKTTKDACIKNDTLRVKNGERKLHSRLSIEKYENKQRMNIDRGYITEIEPSTPFLLDYIEPEDRLLKSETWDAGDSTYCTCWDDENTEHIPTDPEEPNEIRDFYEFFQYIIQYEDLSIEQSLAKYGDLIEIDSGSEGDYYGGCEYTNFYAVSKHAILERFIGDVDGQTQTEIFREERPGDFLCLAL